MPIRWNGVREITTIFDAALLNTIETEAERLERINHNKTVAAVVTAVFVRTCYIFPRLLEDMENPAISQESSDLRISEFYQCGTFTSNDPAFSFLYNNFLNESMQIAVPSLFHQYTNDQLQERLDEFIPFMNEIPSEAQQSPISRLNLRISLEKTLYTVLDDLPPFIYTFIEKDLTDIEEQIIHGYFQLPQNDFYEKLIKVSFVILLFIQRAPCFVPPPGILTLRSYTFFSDAHKTALNMISTVGRALLYDRNPSVGIVPERQSRSYIDPCLKIALYSLGTRSRVHIFLETVRPYIGIINLNPLQPSSPPPLETNR